MFWFYSLHVINPEFQWHGPISPSTAPNLGPLRCRRKISLKGTPTHFVYFIIHITSQKIWKNDMFFCCFDPNIRKIYPHNSSQCDFMWIFLWCVSFKAPFPKTHLFVGAAPVLTVSFAWSWTRVVCQTCPSLQRDLHVDPQVLASIRTKSS